MSERYRSFSNRVGAKAVRLIDIPGMRNLEALKHMNDVARVKEDFALDDRVDEFSVKHFGIAEQDTRISLPENIAQLRRVDPQKAYELEDERHEFEEQFYCDANVPIDDQCAFLFALGWDLRDDNGQPLRLLERFARQIEAAVKQLVEEARLPDNQEIRDANCEAKLAEDVRRYMKQKKAG